MVASKVAGWLHPSAHSVEWAEVMRSAFAAHLFVTGVLCAAEREVFAHGCPLASTAVEANEVDGAVDRLLYRLMAASAFHGCDCLCFVHRCFSGCFPTATDPVAEAKSSVIHLLPLSVYSERGTPIALHAPFTSAAVEPEAYTRPENLLIAW